MGWTAQFEGCDQAACEPSAGHEEDKDQRNMHWEEGRTVAEETAENEGDMFDLEVLLVWGETRRKTASVNTLRLMAYQSMDLDLIDFEEGMDDDAPWSWRRVLQRHVVDPNCKRRCVWDLVSLLFVMYDILMIPLGTFGSQFETGSGPRSIGWLMRTYWTLDIPSQFMTGYPLQDGDVEKDLSLIARHYAHRWLLLDLLVVGVDWLDVFINSLDGFSSHARIGKVMRVMRVIRVLRLLRIARLPLVQGTWLEGYVRSERVMLVGSMFKTIGVIVILLHFIACSWWGIGNLSIHGEDSWAKSDQLQQGSLAWQYATSFHWSLAQFAGDMEVDPRNVLERVFSILTLLFAFVVSAVFVSSITSSMTRLQMILGSKTTMFSELRQYLVDNNISPRLVARVSRNAHRAYAEYQRTTPEADIELLKLVSEPLRVELHFEVYSRVLLSNPFFAKYEKLNPAAVRRVCHTAVEVEFLSAGDVVFVNGEAPRIPQMWFVLNGALSYKSDLDGERKVIGPALSSRKTTSSRFSARAEVIRHSRQQQRLSQAGYHRHSGGWIAEPVLWTAWIHTGVLRAEMDCRLMGLHALSFQEIAPQFSSGTDCLASRYAQKYVERLNAQLRNSHLTDLDECGVGAEVAEEVFEESRPGSTSESDAGTAKRKFFSKMQRSASKAFFNHRLSDNTEERSSCGDISPASSFFKP